MPSTSVSPTSAPIEVINQKIDELTESQIAFNDSPFKWIKYRLGIESFDSVGSYNACTITEFELLAADSSFSSSFASMSMFTILVTLGILLPQCIPLSPIDRGLDVNFFLQSFIGTMVPYAGVWYCVYFFFPMSPNKLLS